MYLSYIAVPGNRLTAFIVPAIAEDKWLETSVALGKDSDKVSLLIEPVLIAENHWSPLYDDVMRTGVPV